MTLAFIEQRIKEQDAYIAGLSIRHDLPFERIIELVESALAVRRYFYEKLASHWLDTIPDELKAEMDKSFEDAVIYGKSEIRRP